MRPILITLTMFIAALSFQCDPRAVLAAVPALESEKVEIDPRIQVWEGLYWADMNTRYHEAMAEWVGNWALGVKVLLTCVSVFLVILNLQHFDFFKNNPKALNITEWIGYAVLIVSIGLLYFPWEDQAAQHASLARQWKSLQGEWRELRGEIVSLDDAELAARAQSLLACQSAMESAEPNSHSDELLEEAQDGVDEEFGVGKFAEKISSAN